MTCIIAAVKDNIGYIAGDKCATQGTKERKIKNSKIFNINEVLLGAAGSIRFINVLQHCITCEEAIEKSRNTDDFAYYLVKELMEACDSQGCLTDINGNKYTPGYSESDVENAGTELLAVYNNDIIRIGVDFSYCILDNNIAGLGIEDSAEGYFEARSGNMDNRIKSVMKYTAKNNSSVSEDYYILKQEQ